MPSQSIILIDPHPVIRIGLQYILESAKYKVVSSFGNPDEFIQAVEHNKLKQDFDIIIMEIEYSSDDQEGLKLIDFIKNTISNVKIIIFTRMADYKTVIDSLRLLVNAYVLKTQNIESIIIAMQQVSEGKNYFGNEITKLLIKSSSNNPQQVDTYKNSKALTSKETEIIKLIAKGLKNKDISTKISISTSTVSAHKQNIVIKLGLNNTSEIIRLALQLFPNSID